MESNQPLWVGEKIIQLGKKREIRKNIKKDMENKIIQEKWFEHDLQKKIIMKLFAHAEPNKNDTLAVFDRNHSEICLASKMKRDIEKKISGYFSQDKKKNIGDREKLITLEETLEKIIMAHFKCHYCLKRVRFIYKHVREPEQWTLDRINNDICHSADNTVLCCLDCNLQKRRRDDKKFLFTKQMKLIKIS